MPSTNSDAERMQNASRVAKAILGAYRDSPTATKEYTVAILQVIASYPADIQTRLADLRTGIPGKFKFLPAVAEIVEFADELTKPKPDLFPGIGLVSYCHSDGRRREVDLEPYRPQIVPYISNRATRNPDHYAAAKVEDAKTREGIRKAEHMLAYVKELGNGSALDGWLIAIESGIGEPPEGWEPK